MRRQLDELDELLDRLLKLPLPSRPEGEAPRLKLAPVDPDEKEGATSRGAEPKAAEPPPALSIVSELPPLPEEAQPAEPAAKQQAEATVAGPPPPAAMLPDQGPDLPASPVPSEPAIASIPDSPAAKAGLALEPASSRLQVGLSALDDQLERALPWLGHAGLKQTLGWLGLLMLAASAALAVGGWLGLRWRL